MYVPKEKTKSQLKEERIKYFENALQRLKQNTEEDMHAVSNHVNGMTRVLGHMNALLLEVLKRKSKTYWIEPLAEKRQTYSLILKECVTIDWGRGGDNQGSQEVSEKREG